MGMRPLEFRTVFREFPILIETFGVSWFDGNFGRAFRFEARSCGRSLGCFDGQVLNLLDLKSIDPEPDHFARSNREVSYV